MKTEDGRESCDECAAYGEFGHHLGCDAAAQELKTLKDQVTTLENRLDQVAEIVDCMGFNDLSYREAAEALYKIVGAPKAAAS
jgi:hypothetical protein